MEEQIVSFKTAKLAKGKGFNIYTQIVYVETLEHTIEMGRGGDYTFPYQAPRVLNSSKFDEWDVVHCKAPTQSLLQKWLREVHSMFVYVDETGRPYIKDIKSKTIAEVCNNDKYAGFKYEEALEFGLFECLQIVPETVA